MRFPTTATLSLLPPLISALPQTPIPIPISSSGTPGCGKRALFPGLTHYVFDLVSSNKSRSYSYHLPANYNPNKPYPVVLGFHGSSSTGLFFELDSKMSEARFSADKIVVYPNGIGGSWVGPSYHSGSGVEEDVRFVGDVVADVGGRACVDGGRVFAVGMSNGGGFIGSLACSPIGSKLFTAFAAGSGAFYTDVNGPDNGCNPARTPVPILEIHGGSDKTVKYGGGQGDGGPQPPITSWLDWWAQRNNCTSKTDETSHDGDVHQFSWTCGGTAGLLQHYRVDSMGHCWADTEPNLSQISVPQGPAPIQASKIVMEFFDKFGKTA